MRERSDGFGFALEASLRRRIVGELGRQDFDRHVAIEPGVARPIDFAHTAAADRRDDLVESEPRAGGQSHLAT